MLNISRKVAAAVIFRYWLVTMTFILLVTVGCQQAEVASNDDKQPTVEPVASPASPTEAAEPDQEEIESQVTNTSWDPIIEEFDGIMMARVPAGCFMMGEEGIDRAEPVHEVCITEPYWIDVTEVSNAQFLEFDGVAAHESTFPGQDVDGADQPRTSVTWEEADAFCQLRGARLPTEAEWEYAARGPAAWLYPWGDQFNPSYLNACDQNCTVASSVDPGDYQAANDGFAVAAPVESLPDGASWVGALHMAGNVAEWVADYYGANYYSESPHEDPGGPTDGSQHVVKSMPWSWYIDLDRNAQASNRWDFVPDGTSKDFSGTTGFRCALSGAER